MEKKTHKRQTSIVTLSDQNTKEIQDIRDQKERMLASYEEKKAKLRAIMLEKEAALAKLKQELDDLAEYKVHFAIRWVISGLVLLNACTSIKFNYFYFAVSVSL